MPFLSLNNYGVDIMDGSFTVTREVIGYRARSFSASLRENRRAEKRIFQATTSIVTPTMADALVSLIEGKGHRFSFDSDYYSSKGLGPASGGSYSRADSGGKDGGKLTAGSGSYIRYQVSVPVSGECTVFVYKYVSSSWDRYALQDAGAGQWKNGANHSASGSDSADNFLSLSGTTTITVDVEGKTIAGVNGASDYDDLVILPYEPPDAMMDAFTSSSFIFPELPKIKLDGDCVQDGPVLALGQVDDVEYHQCVIDGTWYDNAQQITFRLEEV